jgi:hypothetical protein
MAFGEQRLVINHFTSSMCSPCKTDNENMQLFLATRPNETVITKYQVPIPVAGDKYYFPDGEIRRAYYSVNSAPSIFFNGELIIRDDFEKRFQQYFATQVPVIETRGNWNMDADFIMNIDFNVAAYEDIQDAVVHVTINKKRTTGNVGNNEETQFFHVMMKMLPDGHGTTTNFSRYEVKQFNFTYDMKLVRAQLEPEDQNMDNFEVNVFVQNKTTKKIYNGNWLLERNDLINTPPSDLELTVFEVKQTGLRSVAEWKAPDNDKFTGYNVYINDEKVASNISATTYEYSTPEDDIIVVKVAAVYPNNVESVRIAAYQYTLVGGVNEIAEDNVFLYPNPARDQITVKAEKNMKSIEVYNTIGQLQYQFNPNAEHYILNVAHYTAGIYLVKITFEDNTTANKKVIIK